MSEAKENQYYKTRDVVVKNGAKIKKTKPPASACAHDTKENGDEKIILFFLLLFFRGISSYNLNA